MDWNRSNVIGLAKASCKLCQGSGIWTTERRGRESPCNCVYRAIFRACYNRFRECGAGSRIGMVHLEFSRGPEGRHTFSRKREEYMADFCLVSRRVLDDFEHKIFRYHYLLGADWRLCTRQLKMDRGNFFHMVYRIQQKLGKALAELSPYSLYPVADYFAASLATVEATPVEKVQPRMAGRIRLPLTA
jgi:hypothetical protein